MIFYLRESSGSDLASYHALSTCCPLMRVRVLRPELNLKELFAFVVLYMNAYNIMTIMLNSMIFLLLVQVNVSSLKLVLVLIR